MSGFSDSSTLGYSCGFSMKPCSTFREKDRDCEYHPKCFHDYYPSDEGLGYDKGDWVCKHCGKVSKRA